MDWQIDRFTVEVCKLADGHVYKWGRWIDRWAWRWIENGQLCVLTVGNDGRLTDWQVGWLAGCINSRQVGVLTGDQVGGLKNRKGDGLTV